MNINFSDLVNVIRAEVRKALLQYNFGKGDFPTAHTGTQLNLAQAYPSVVYPSAVNAPGIGTLAAHYDHQHGLYTSAPASDIGDSDSAGASLWYVSKADHGHRIPRTLGGVAANAGDVLTWSGTLWNPQAPSGGGVSLSSAPPTIIYPSSTLGAGIGTTASRFDHQHQLYTSAPASDIGDNDSAGVSQWYVSKADHAHRIPSTLGGRSANPNDVLVWNGTQWKPGAAAGLINLLVNPGLEYWSSGAGPFTAGGAVTADGWYIALGTSDTLSVSQDSANSDTLSRYDAVATYVKSGGGSALYQPLSISPVQLVGQAITVSIRVKCATASAVRVYISDNGGLTYGAYHSGGGAYETLTLTHTVAAGTTVLKVGIDFETSCTAYIDSATLAVGSTALPYALQNQRTESDLWLEDVTTNDVALTHHGLAPKLPNDATKFLNGTGNYSAPFYSDTKANILAANKPIGTFALATDTNEIYVSVGTTSWQKSPFALVIQSANPDMGAYQDSSHIGISPTYITDKLIANSRIGSNANMSNEGDIGVSSGTLYIRLLSTNKAVVTGFVFRETGNGAPALEHQPIGYSWYYEVSSGNSVDNLDMDGNPLVLDYTANMGCYSTPQVLDGGTV